MGLMENQKPAHSKLPVFAQLCKLIPPHLVPKLDREHGIDKQARTFTPWSHVASLLFAQLTHSFGLNDVCDTLRIPSRWLGSLRGAFAPTRNTLSHANKTRDSNMMEALFWRTLTHLDGLVPGGFGIRHKGLPRRFRKAIHAVDSSTIALVANCMNWAKHRRRKAAAKLHLRLNLQSFLPGFAIVEEASHHDDTRAVALCGGTRASELQAKIYTTKKAQEDTNLSRIYFDWVHRLQLYGSSSEGDANFFLASPHLVSEEDPDFPN